ncbi:uncharacterized protein LOC143253951 [Tachypleus tridentatus]|uniref:uncharacterized protein LOC143253951 n=1 Tax=Tachypleus tridentatus TaxID=6853 RepID=UPI003FCFAB0D
MADTQVESGSSLLGNQENAEAVVKKEKPDVSFNSANESKNNKCFSNHQMSLPPSYLPSSKNPQNSTDQQLKATKNVHAQVQIENKELVSPPIDISSIQGIFGWTTIGGVHLPFILRGQDKFIAVRMVEAKVVSKYSRILPWVVFTCTNIKSYFITENEARLLNEINGFHCAFQFGQKTFTSKDVVVCLSEILCFHEFLETCRSKLFPVSGDRLLAKKCGLIMMNNIVLPYIDKSGSKYVPFTMLPNGVLADASRNVNDWDLAYLYFLCHVAQLNKTKLKRGTYLVSVDKLFFSSGQVPVIQEWWPKTPLLHINNGHMSPSHSPDCIQRIWNVSVFPDQVTRQTVNKYVEQQEIQQLQVQTSNSAKESLEENRLLSPFYIGHHGAPVGQATSPKVNGAIHDGFQVVDNRGQPIPTTSILRGHVPAVPASGYLVPPPGSLMNHLDSPSLSSSSSHERPMYPSLNGSSGTYPVNNSQVLLNLHSHQLGGHQVFSPQPVTASLVQQNMFGNLVKPGSHSSAFHQRHQDSLPELHQRQQDSLPEPPPLILDVNCQLNGGGNSLRGSHSVRNASVSNSALRHALQTSPLSSVSEAASNMVLSSLTESDSLNSHSEAELKNLRSPTSYGSSMPPPHYPTPPQSTPTHPSISSPLLLTHQQNRATSNAAGLVIDLCSPPPSPVMRATSSSHTNEPVMSESCGISRDADILHTTHSTDVSPFSYKKIHIEGRQLPVVNLDLYQNDKNLATSVSEMVHQLFPSLSATSCQFVLQNVLGVTLYEYNRLQMDLMMKHGVSISPDDKLVTIKDLESYMPQLKYMFERGGQPTSESSKHDDAPPAKRHCFDNTVKS